MSDRWQDRICRARREHRCTERSYHTIRPGDFYLRCTAPPWHEMNRSNKWWTIRACLRCAKEFGMLASHTREVVEAIEAKPYMMVGG